MQPSYLSIASQSERLLASSYPLHATARIRWSDLQDGCISRVATAQFFEDMRVQAMRDLLGTPQVMQMPWHALLRAVTLEHLAPARWGEGDIELAAGIAGIGTSSFSYALAAFQAGRCIALSEAVDVCIGPDIRPLPLKPDERTILERGLMPHAAGPKGAKPKGPAIAGPQQCPWEVEFTLRFSDTDKVGHVNNVAMLRYHDNAAMAFIHDVLEIATPTNQRLLVHRQLVSIDAETFYPEPLTLHGAVTELEQSWFALTLLSYQSNRCTSTSRTVIACQDGQGQPVALSVPLVARLMSLLARP